LKKGRYNGRFYHAVLKQCEVAKRERKKEKERENVHPSDYAIKSDAFFIPVKNCKVYKVIEILITI